MPPNKIVFNYVKPNISRFMPNWTALLLQLKTSKKQIVGDRSVLKHEPFGLVGLKI